MITSDLIDLSDFRILELYFIRISCILICVTKMSQELEM